MSKSADTSARIEPPGAALTDGKISQAIALIERFKNANHYPAQEAERFIVELFQACGRTVNESGFVENDGGVVSLLVV